MLSKTQARAALLETFPLVSIEDSILYNDIYLFRVAYPSPAERDYDPFISVNVNSGEVRDFNIMLDGDITEISRLFEATKR